MARSCEEQRMSAELDRVLADDPFLFAMADLAARSIPDRRRPRSRVRQATVVVIGVVALVVALAGSFVAAVAGPSVAAGRAAWAWSESQPWRVTEKGDLS
ncbi:MAG TPA: DUF3040 domain-containing protein [Pseudonocardiaceae bacterium]|nr:DUF3040 domain-containing protein [Pseudonocardiaceae bacterium]